MNTFFSAANVLARRVGSSGRTGRQSGANRRLYLWPYHRAGHRAMGLQNATARKLAVPDLTTTVLTLTIVGISADSRLVGGSGSKAGRRLISVLAMLVGALVGSLLIFRVSITSPLVIAFIVMAIVAVTTRGLSRTDPTWVRAS